MDQSLIRGAVAALLVLDVLAAPRAHAQAAGSIQVRPLRDSVVVRVIDANAKAKIDSIMLKWRLFEEESGVSEQGMRMRQEMEAMFRELSMHRGGPGGTILFRSSGPDFRQFPAARLKGWIGLTAGLAPRDEMIDSTGYYVHYYRYPSVVSVEPNSPAHRAGIAAGDVLVAYDGQDVVRGRVNLAALLIPERKLEVTVRRDGESHDFSLVVAKTPERIAIRRLEPGEVPLPPDRIGFSRGGGVVAAMPPGDGPMRIEVAPSGFGGGTFNNRVWFMDRNGILGAGLVTINAELAKATRLEKGVLIQECGEGTPAFKGGLRTGDVIVSVAGQLVNTVGDVQSMVYQRRNEKVVTLQVVRDKKPIALNVKW